MAEHPVEGVERHRHWDRPCRVMLLLNAAIHQAGVHGSHDGNVVPPLYACDSPGLLHTAIPENYIDSDAWDPNCDVLPLF